MIHYRRDIERAFEKVGDRFVTPAKYLEDARLFRAVYTPFGPKED